MPKSKIVIGDFEVTVVGSSRFPQPFIFHTPTKNYLTKNKRIEYTDDLDRYYYGNVGAAVSAVHAYYRRAGIPIPQHQYE